MAEPRFNTPTTISPAIQEYMSGRVDGVSQRALKLKRLAKIQSLQATGVAKPATVFNFNPVALRLEGGLDGKVPSSIDPAIPDDQRIQISYKNRTYKASVRVFREPVVYPIIKDVSRAEGQDMADGVGIYDIEVCKQIEIVHAIWTSYNRGSSESSGMGGVLVFEGDRHAFREATKSGQILVPEFISLPTRTREYFSRPQSLEEVIANTLEPQKVYCENQMQIAQAMHDDPDQRKSITNTMRIWGQYSIAMGWTPESQIIDWLLRRDQPLETCVGCGAAKKLATAYFCHSCSRPYDAFQCYMDGELGFDANHVQALHFKDPAKWAQVEKEEKRRRSMRKTEPKTEAKTEPKE